jgi:hypothetical protein
MTVPNEIWFTLEYLAVGFVIALSACIFFSYIGTFVIGWISEAFELMKL